MVRPAYLPEANICKYLPLPLPTSNLLAKRLLLVISSRDWVKGRLINLLRQLQHRIYIFLHRRWRLLLGL